jgi:hypothetical protein
LLDFCNSTVQDKHTTHGQRARGSSTKQASVGIVLRPSLTAAMPQCWCSSLRSDTGLLWRTCGCRLPQPCDPRGSAGMALRIRGQQPGWQTRGRRRTWRRRRSSSRLFWPRYAPVAPRAHGGEPDLRLELSEWECCARVRARVPGSKADREVSVIGLAALGRWALVHQRKGTNY